MLNLNGPLARDAEMLVVGAALAATDHTVDGEAIAAKAAPAKKRMQPVTLHWTTKVIYSANQYQSKSLRNC